MNMNAKKCDRCGSFYTVEIFEANPFEELAHSLKCLSQNRASMENMIMKIENIIDLCPECSKSLKKWIRAKEKREEQQNED